MFGASFPFKIQEKNPNIKNLGGRGLRGPKILYAEILRVFFWCLKEFRLFSTPNPPPDPKKKFTLFFSLESRQGNGVSECAQHLHDSTVAVGRGQSYIVLSSP